MIRRDLLTGHWKPYLERAISLKPCYEGGINGGEVPSLFLEFCDQLYILILHLCSNVKIQNIGGSSHPAGDGYWEKLCIR